MDDEIKVRAETVVQPDDSMEMAFMKVIKKIASDHTFDKNNARRRISRQQSIQMCRQVLLKYGLNWNTQKNGGG